MAAPQNQQIPGQKFETYGYPIVDDVEDLDRYQPGGFHPVVIGDALGEDGRFEVVHKLGHGGFATVWLCFDHHNNKWKAVRILAADASDHVEPSELRILKHFDGVTDRELEENHICLPRDNFWVVGPNGRHLCNILPVFGRSTEKICRQWGHNSFMIRRLCFQLTKAMTFMHTKGVCHGDFRPKNILFKLRDVETLSYDQIYKWIPDSGRIALPVIPNPAYPEGPGPHLPHYVYPSAALEPPRQMVTPDIVIGDFGEAYHVDEGPCTTGIPRKYAAPEVVLRGHALGFGADVWALGATFCEAIKGLTPFSDDGVLEYTKVLEDMLGPLPEPYRTTWIEWGCKPRAELPPAAEIPLTEPVTMTPSRLVDIYEERIRDFGYASFLDRILRPKTGFYREMVEGESAATLAPWETDNGDGWKHIQFQTPPEEADQLLDLLNKVFKYQPNERLTAADVLAHPWFSHEGVVPGDDVVEAMSDGDDHALVDESEDEVLDAEILFEEDVVPVLQRDGPFEWLAWVLWLVMPWLYEGAMALGDFLCATKGY